MKTTLKKIRSYNPCRSGWITLIEGLGTDDPNTEVTLLQILEINGGGCGYLVAEQISPSCLHDMTDDDLKDGVLYTYADPFSNLRSVFLMKGKGIIIPSSVVRHRNNNASSPERIRT